MSGDDWTFIDWAREWVANGGGIHVTEYVDPDPTSLNGLFPNSQSVVRGPAKETTT